MKKIVLILSAFLLSCPVFSQDFSRWAFTLSGGAGFNITGNFDRHYGWHGDYDDCDDYDCYDDIYQNSEIQFSFDAGVKFYVFKWAYLKTGVGYAKYQNKFDKSVLGSNIRNADKTLSVDGLYIPFVVGFKYPVDSRFYPFIEFGTMVFTSFNNDFSKDKVHFGGAGKFGCGFHVTDNIALELASSFNSIYGFKSSYNSDIDRKTRNQQFGIGFSLGLNVNF